MLPDEILREQLKIFLSKKNIDFIYFKDITGIKQEYQIVFYNIEGIFNRIDWSKSEEGIDFWFKCHCEFRDIYSNYFCKNKLYYNNSDVWED